MRKKNVSAPAEDLHAAAVEHLVIKLRFPVLDAVAIVAVDLHKTERFVERDRCGRRDLESVATVTIVVDRVEKRCVARSVRQHFVSAHIVRLDRVRALRMTARHHPMRRAPIVNHLRVSVREKFISRRPDPNARRGRFRTDRHEDRRIIKGRGAAVKFLILRVEYAGPVPAAAGLRDGHVVKERNRDRRSEMLRKPLVEFLVRQREKFLHRVRIHIVHFVPVRHRVEDHDLPLAFRNVPDDLRVRDLRRSLFRQVDPLPRLEIHRDRRLNHAVFPVLVQFPRKTKLRSLFRSRDGPLFHVETLRNVVRVKRKHLAAGGS